jgi:molybdate transport system ATP-binding protein
MPDAERARLSILRIDRLLYKTGDFSLEIECELNRKSTGIFGPSGAGKTTLLEIIAGLRRPAAGAIWSAGNELFDLSAGRYLTPGRRGLGYVPQDLALFPHKTVSQNLLFGEPLHMEEFDHVIQEFELKNLLQRFPSELSGGEKQRVAIGRALMIRPRLLMLDEPLSSVDRALKSRALELFRRVRERFDTPILYVSHDPGELAEICEEVVILEAGRLIGQGAVEQIFQAVERTEYIYTGQEK